MVNFELVNGEAEGGFTINCRAAGCSLTIEDSANRVVESRWLAPVVFLALRGTALAARAAPPS
jgi:hypothetical protein